MTRPLLSRDGTASSSSESEIHTPYLRGQWLDTDDCAAVLVSQPQAG